MARETLVQSEFDRMYVGKSRNGRKTPRPLGKIILSDFEIHTKD